MERNKSDVTVVLAAPVTDSSKLEVAELGKSAVKSACTTRENCDIRCSYIVVRNFIPFWDVTLGNLVYYSLTYFIYFTYFT
jgi:hypothetical protein